MEKKDNISLLFSLAALIVACVSLRLSFRAQERDTKEDIEIFIRKHRGGYAVTLEDGFPIAGYPVILPVRWDIEIYNNGKVPVIFKKSRVLQVTEDYPQDYSGIDGCLSENGKTEYRIPFKVTPGDYKRLQLSIGTLIDETVYGKVKEEFPLGVEILSRRFISRIQNTGTDIFGNPIRRIEYDGGGIKIEYPKDIRDGRYPIFIFVLESSRGNRFLCRFSEYELFP